MEKIVPELWTEQTSSMPYMLGGAEHQIKNLRLLCEKIVSGDNNLDNLIELNGESNPVKIRNVVRFLKGAGFFEQKGANNLSLSRELLEWFDTGDNFKLFSLMHINVRFVGECLKIISEHPMEINSILELANQDFQCNWKSYDQVRRRLSWFRSMGLAEYKTTKLIGITNLGLEYLSKVETRNSNDIYSSQKDLNFNLEVYMKSYPYLADVIFNLSQNELQQRNNSFGYIPNKTSGGLFRSLLDLTNLIKPNIERRELIDGCIREFGISESSFNSAFGTLNKLNLVDEVGFAKYSQSNFAKEWTSLDDPLYLVLLIHCNIRGVIEIIGALKFVDKAPAVARMLKEKLNLPREDVEGTRKKIQLMKSAGLVEERSNWRFVPTPLGSSVYYKIANEFLNLEDEHEAVLHEPKILNQEYEEEIDLISAGVDSDNSSNLEKSVARAFEKLGFNVKLIGGSGDTDVLVSLEDRSGNVFRATIDAKSSRSGNVNEHAVSFDTLLEHRKKNNAQYSVIIGPGFETGRIKTRAKNNSVRLITTDELNSILEKHKKLPLSAEFYVNLLSASEGSYDKLKQKWSEKESQLEVLGKVLDVLKNEKLETDSVTNGALTTKEIYLMMRDNSESQINLSDISAALSLLLHPFLGAVRKEKEKYYLIDSPDLIKRKISSLLEVIGSE